MSAKVGKKTGKPVTDGIRSNKRKEEQDVQKTQTLKSTGQVAKKTGILVS